MTRQKETGPEASFVRSLFDPFASPPSRFPDLLATASSTTASFVRFTASSVQMGATSSAGLLVTVFPHVGSSAFSTGTANAAKAVVSSVLDAAGTPTANTFVNDPLRGNAGSSTGAAYSNWSSYRTTAMGVRVRNLTPVLTRSGMVASRLTVVRPGQNAEVIPISEVMSFRTSDVLDAATLPVDGLVATWLPNNYTDLSFNATADTNFLPALQIAWSGLNANPQTFEIEIVTHYEFRPLDSMEYLFDVSPAMGSPAKVEGLVATVMQKAGDPSVPNFPQRALKVVDEIISSTADTASRAVHRARRVSRHAAGLLLPARAA